MKTEVIYYLLNKARNKFISSRDLYKEIFPEPNEYTMSYDEFKRTLADIQNDFNDEAAARFESGKTRELIYICSSAKGYCSSDDPQIHEEFFNFYGGRTFPVLKRIYRMKKLTEKKCKRKIQFGVPLPETSDEPSLGF